MSTLKIPQKDFQKMLFAHPESRISIERAEYLGKDLSDTAEPNTRYYLYVGYNNITGKYACVAAEKEQIDNSEKFEKQTRARVEYVLTKGENK
jgi:hypothetical protein